MYEQLCDKNIHLAVKNWCKQDNSAALLQYGHISMWDVSNVTNASSLFLSEDEFNDNISNWNVSNVRNMTGMFYGAVMFNQPLNRWNVSNMTSMCSIFVRTH